MASSSSLSHASASDNVSASSAPVSASAHVLARALAADPFYAAITAHLPEAERPSALARYMEASLTEGRTPSSGRVVEVPHGAAIWTVGPVDPAVSQTKRDTLRATIGPPGLAMYDAIISVMEPSSAQVTDASMWYLSILGIDPAHQRQGIGTRVLAPTLAEADAAHKTCFLETYDDNLGFYERLGFLPRQQFVETTTGAKYWVLIRPPRAVI
jgi:ribosomal protein S18 acetylase RimI-like enzyme